MSAPEKTLYFHQLQLGPMENFAYLIGDPVTRECVAVDPAWDVDGLLAQIERDDMRLTKILITHFHPDHLGGSMMGHHVKGAAELLERGVEAKIYMNKVETPYAARVADLSSSDVVAIESGDRTSLGTHELTFIHTPGHTPGSQCFLIDGRLVSGDTLFIGSCGRVDLPGSDPEQMYYSLTQRLAALPDETVVYPGHNYANRPFSSLGEEKRHNPFLRFANLKEFLAVMSPLAR